MDVVFAVRIGAGPDPAAMVENDLVPVIEQVATGIPVALRADGRVLTWLAEHRPDLVEGLRVPQLEWLGGGWSDPVLAMLPRRDRQRQLEWEAEVIEATFGGTVAGAWPALDLWDGYLAEALTAAGLRFALIDQGAFLAGGTPIERLTRPGVVDHLGAPLVVLPLVTDLVATAQRRGMLAALARQDPDGLLVIAVSGSELAGLTEMVGSIEGLSPTTPTAHLGEHRPSGRALLAEAWGGRSAAGWRRALAEDAGADLLYRKMLRISDRLPERPPAGAVEGLLAAQAHDLYFSAGNLGGRLAGHRRLIQAGAALDRGRGVVTRLDWDADGDEELAVELPELSAVLDPAEGGFLYLDDKVAGRPVSLGRCLTLRPHRPVRSELSSLAEQRNRVEVEMSSPFHRTRVLLERRRIDLRLSFSEASPAPIGPQIPLVLDAGAELRVDGGGWRSLAASIDTAGHRFRIRAGDYGVLLTLPRPGEVSFEPSPEGLVVWPHWPAAAGGEYELTLELQA